MSSNNTEFQFSELERQNILIMKRLFKEIWNEKRKDTINEIISSNFITYFEHETIIGRTNWIERFYNVLINAIPDITVTVDDYLPNRDSVVSRWKAHGTYKGELFGVSPTGKDITISGISWTRLANGKLVESWNNWDMSYLMKKLGESLELTQFSLDNAADAIFWVTEDAKLIYVNDAAVNMLGYTREEVTTMYTHDINPNYPPEVWSDHWKEVKDRGSFTFESTLKAKDGRIIPVEITVNHIVFDNKEYNCAFTRDITERKQAEAELLKSRNELELRVKERTLELQEKNIALKVLLKQREEDKSDLEQNILSNVKSLIQPYIMKLKRNNLNLEDVSYLNIIESNLEDIISPFSQKLSSKYMNFTSKEIEIANLIKEGKKDKEIMEIMNIAFDTVKAHRKNIRKKLGIHGKGTNLKNKLLSM